MAEPPKKRRLQESAGNEEEDEDSKLSLFRVSQNKALAGNLFRYKRQIAQLNAELQSDRLAHSGIIDVLAAVDRVLSQVEQAAESLHAALPEQVRSDAENGVEAPLSIAVLQARQLDGGQAAAPWAIAAAACGANVKGFLQPISALLQTIDTAVGALQSSQEPVWLPSAFPILSASVASSLGPEPADGVLGSALALQAREALTSSLNTRLQHLLRLGGALSRAVSRMPPASVDEALAAVERKRKEAGETATALWDALAVRSQELSAERMRSVRLDLEAHRAVRALERIRVSHPELQAEIRAVGAGEAQGLGEGHALAPAGLPVGRAAACGSAGPSGVTGCSVGEALSADTPGLTGQGVIGQDPGDADMLSSSDAHGSTAMPPPPPIGVGAFHVHMGPPSSDWQGYGSGGGTPFSMTGSGGLHASHTPALSSSLGVAMNYGSGAALSTLCMGQGHSLSISAPAYGQGGEDGAGATTAALRTEVERLQSSLREAERGLASARADVDRLKETIAEASGGQAEACARADAEHARAAELGADLLRTRMAPPSEAHVRAHALYADKASALAAETSRAAALKTQVSVREGQLASAKDSLASERRRSADLMAAAGRVDVGAGGATVAALEASVVKLKSLLSVAVKEREEALARAGKAAADGEAGLAYAVSARQAMASVAEWKAQYTVVHAALGLARQHAEAAAEAEAAGTAIPQDEVMAGLVSERDAYLSGLTDVSAAFEAAQTSKDSVLEVLRERDSALARGILEKQRSLLERASLAAESAAKDAVIAEAVSARSALEAALTARDGALTEAKAAADEAKEAAAGAAREIAAVHRKEELRAAERAIADFQAQAAAAGAQAESCRREAEAANAAAEKASSEAAKLREEVAMLRARVTKREEKVASLREDLEKERNTGRDRARALGGSTGTPAATPGAAELLSIRSMVFCSVCKANHRDTAIFRCGHVFCSGCIDKRIKDRSRKCPSCGIAFAESDVKKIHLQSS